MCGLRLGKACVSNPRQNNPKPTITMRDLSWELPTCPKVPETPQAELKTYSIMISRYKRGKDHTGSSPKKLQCIYLFVVSLPVEVDVLFLLCFFFLLDNPGCASPLIWGWLTWNLVGVHLGSIRPDTCLIFLLMSFEGFYWIKFHTTQKRIFRAAVPCSLNQLSQRTVCRYLTTRLIPYTE